ncbi:IclR family transcriptional regulator domain-containing protein [Microbacterium flavum]|uniref:Helix-turn-helix domain-containing protein n=1 Tax=Microbacterium flavum TaxID=415216 RepID=A0ABS5XWT7_9MICO|nr:IclR family transcriptional regulator C-terminal domain-containing protein [Microbacterium flavum]MBT8799005.1 helix-turn-helix domain-containing protein [Microbacterium flavum]
MAHPSSLLQGLTLVEEAVRRERSGRLPHNASRLAEASGIERSRVSRLTKELRDLGYLERDEASLFGAGSGYFHIASALTQPWLRAARRELRRLAGAHDVTSLVATADGPAAVLARIESPAGHESPYLHAGARVPIWCTGAGRALLWDHAEADISALLDDVQFVGVGGPGAPRSVAEVIDRQDRDRDRGVIDAAQEYVEGVQEYALPVRGLSGIVGAVGVGAAARGSRRTREMQAALRAVADRLSALAGGDG